MNAKLLLSSVIALASVTAMAENHTLYVNNQSGHDLCVYAWANGNPDLFGGWPGASASGTMTIEGTEYMTFELPDSEVPYNFILNWPTGEYDTDGNAKYGQLNDVTVVPNKDLYIKATETSAQLVSAPGESFTLYVDNQTGQDVVSVYAWANGKPELFGGWPGASSNGSETIEGIKYLTYDLPASDTTYNLIINWNGGQYDGPSIVPNKDIFLKAEVTGATVVSDPRVQTFNFYVQDNTGWDTLYIYAYANNAPSIFGGWPGAQASSTTTINGTTYKVFPFEGSEASVNLIFNNNNGTQFDGPSVVLNKDYYFVVTSDSCNEKTDVSTVITSIDEDNNDTPIYYTTTGIRVENPSNGIYIVVKGTKRSKVSI